MSILRFGMLLALVIWVGSIVFFSFAVAPTLFAVLPSRHLAGLVVTRALASLHWIGAAAGLIFLALSIAESYYGTGNAQVTAWRNVLVAAMVALLSYRKPWSRLEWPRCVPPWAKWTTSLSPIRAAWLSASFTSALLDWRE